MIYDDLEKICNHYGIRKQLKKFAEESYELEEAVIDSFEEVIDVFGTRSVERTDHIAEELADVMVLWEQIRLYYCIPSQTIQGVIEEKVNKQLKRMEE